MLCPNCNQQIPDKSKYCIKCGQRISRSKTATRPQDEPLNESYRLLSTILASTIGGASSQEAIESLLKRGKSFLEEGEWKSADMCFDRALDLNSEFAPAYIGKLCAERKVSAETVLADLQVPLNGKSNYEKALRFADEPYRQVLQQYNQSILDQIEARRKEAHLEAQYKMGKEYISTAWQLRDTYAFTSAIDTFKEISGYRDADELAEKCAEEASRLRIVWEQEAQEAEKQRLLREKEKHDAEAQRLKCELEEQAKRTRNRKIILLFMSAAFVFGIFVVVLNAVIIPANNYNKAVEFLEAGEYSNAALAFEALGDYKDSPERVLDVYFVQGESLLAQKNYSGAIAAFEQAGDYRDAAEQIAATYYAQGETLLAQKNYAGAIVAFEGAGDYQDAAHNAKIARIGQLLAEGKRKVVAQLYRQDGEVELALQYGDPSDWLSAGSNGHAVGLRANGTLITEGNTGSGQRLVGGWTDIVAVSAGGNHTVGLRADGTVVAVGDNEYGQCNVSSWTDVIAISAGGGHTVGLRADGTVVAAGNNRNGECDVSGWTDIVAVSAGYSLTVGLRADGTVMAMGWNEFGECDVSGWTDIVAASVGLGYAVGLRTNGTVVVAGKNEFGECDVSGWTDIVAVSAGGNHTVGLCADGTVVAVGNDWYNQCNVSGWTDIVAVSVGFDYTIGLRADGKVVATGNNEYGQCNISEWNLFSNMRVPSKNSDSSGVYFYPSDTQYITEYELSCMTRDNITLIRNEIYARHGYIFQAQTWIDYFNAQWWYTPNEYFDTSMFNTIESENIKTITAYEKERGWKS